MFTHAAITNAARLLLLAALTLILPAHGIHASEKAARPPALTPTGIYVSFQLDPRLTRGLYMGDRWVSPPTYVGAVGQDNVMVRAEVLDAKGKPTEISPEWAPADPDMVDVSPRKGKEVKITVRRAGQSTLRVASSGLSRELIIKAAEKGNGLHIEISQGQAPVAKPPEVGKGSGKGPDAGNQKEKASYSPGRGKKKESAGERRRLAEKNKKEGEIFLAENAGKEGVVTLPSGLQYKIITAGTGKQPAGTDKVYVNYRGTFPDGTEFDNSRKKGKPAVIKVDKVMKGWSEALQLMKEGSKWMLYIPSDLAYGERGAGARIGPNQALVFEVELISVQ